MTNPRQTHPRNRRNWIHRQQTHPPIIGSRLRDPRAGEESRADSSPEAGPAEIEIVHADVMEPASLAPALKDVHTAYYLVHNMSLGYGYTKREMQAARNFVLAAEEAGVQHIIYLGGLADDKQPIAPHLRSRIETGAALRQGKSSCYRISRGRDRRFWQYLL